MDLSRTPYLSRRGGLKPRCSGPAALAAELDIVRRWKRPDTIFKALPRWRNVMRKRRYFSFHYPALLLTLTAFSGVSSGQEVSHAGHNVADMKFVQFPGMPACSTGSVQSGDPSKGPSVILAKVATGCTFPWHWHTPAETLMIVSGVARVEMKDGKPVTLRAGGFALMPSKHVHRFSCVTSCAFFVHSDAAFDIHYVDGQGQEISPEEALKVTRAGPSKTPK